MRSRPEVLGSAPGWITMEHESGGLRVLCVRGEVDTATVAQFYAVYGAVPLVVDEVDAGTVTFMSSTGLALLLRCTRESRAAGRRPVLRASSRPVDRLLGMAGMEDLLPRPDPAHDHPGGPG
jgi:anti-anti-sigma factor